MRGSNPHCRWPVLLLIALLTPLSARAQLMFAEREVVRMLPRLELSYSAVKKTEQTDVGLGVDTEYTRSRVNANTLTYWGKFWGAGVNGSLDEDEKITGNYSVSEKETFRGSFAALHFKGISVFTSDETLVKSYELEVPILGQSIQRRMEVNTDYHLGAEYAFYFVSVGFSGGREQLHLNVRNQTGVLFDETFSFFSHTRYAAISMRGGKGTGITVLWLVKDSPRALGKDLDLLSYGQILHRVGFDLGSVRFMFERSITREEVGSEIQMYGYSRRYNVGFDFGDISFNITQEFQEKSNHSTLVTLPVLDASTRNLTRVGLEYMF